jgi:prepilin-type N-terminal cleavage/methylation domain-containing protein
MSMSKDSEPKLTTKIASGCVCRQSGFTLIELAVVIAVAAVVLGVVLQLVTSQMENAQATSMRSKFETIRSALVMFVARNNRLPCPAIEMHDTGNVAYGLEAQNPGVCTDATPLGGGIAMRGMVPFRSLGLTDEDVLDVYSSRFTYVVTTAATALTEATVAGMTGEITLHDNEPVVLGLPSAGNQINACSAVVPNDNGCNRRAVVLLLSHGRNAAGSYLQSGQRTPDPTSAREAENTDNDENFVLMAHSDLEPAFDDQMLALTPDMLLSGLIRDGAIRSGQAITQDQLRIARDTAVGLIFNNDGGIPTTLPTYTDGWGQTLDYSPHPTFTSVCGASLGTVAFTIRSRGPDKVDAPSATGVNDDITRVQLVDDLKALVTKIRGAACT